jgi:hypothetical protein
MKRRVHITLGVLALSFAAALPKSLGAEVFESAAPIAKASYNAPLGIVAIASYASGETYIRFANLPTPGPCGINNAWVVIHPTASASMKALAETLYLNRKAVTVVTAGCFGTYERVEALYSPGG